MQPWWTRMQAYSDCHRPALQQPADRRSMRALVRSPDRRCAHRRSSGWRQPPPVRGHTVATLAEPHTPSSAADALMSQCARLRRDQAGALHDHAMQQRWPPKHRRCTDYPDAEFSPSSDREAACHACLPRSAGRPKRLGMRLRPKMLPPTRQIRGMRPREACPARARPGR